LRDWNSANGFVFFGKVARSGDQSDRGSGNIGAGAASSPGVAGLCEHAEMQSVLVEPKMVWPADGGGLSRLTPLI